MYYKDYPNKSNNMMITILNKIIEVMLSLLNDINRYKR